MTRTSPSQSCPYFPHLGPVGCLPAPNIFPLAKEIFAKGKMFWSPRPAARLTRILNIENWNQSYVVFVCIYLCICVTPSGQTKNDTDLEFGTHTPVDLI